MHFDGHSFEESSFFQCLAASQDGVTNDGIVLLVESGSQGLNDCLLCGELESTKPLVG